MSRTLFVALATASAVVVGGCKWFRMDVTDNIRVENRSDLKIDLLVNFDYPDTTFARTWINTYIDPHDHGYLTLLNGRWVDLLQERGQVTVFFADYKPADFYNQGRRGPQRVYSILMLTRERLDSLGWVITFTPPPAGVN